MEYDYNYQSLRKHKVTPTDISEVLDIQNISRRDFDMPMTDSYNLRIMFVGYNFAGRLLEVGVEFNEEKRAYVFHTQTVSPQYRKLYENKL